MSKVILPIIEKPPIRCYHKHSYPLGILLNDEDAMKWLYSNYIQLTYKPNDGCYFDFYNTYFFYWDFFERQHMLNETLSINNVSRNDFIKNAIKLGNYVHACVDEYYIPDRYGYKKYHFVHDILVYGYDEEENTYNVIGYVYNGMYKTSLIHFDEFEKANPEWINLFKIKPNNKYFVDLKLIAELLKDYLFPEKIGGKYNMSQIPIDEDLFGMDVYKWFLSFLKDMKLGVKDLDIRPFGVLLEHKECMLNRLKYLKENELVKIDSQLIKDYENIVNDTLILRNMFLKIYMTKKNMELFDNIIIILERIIKKEQEVLTKVLKEIQLVIR